MEDTGESRDGRRSARISQPLESTRMVTGPVPSDDRSSTEDEPPANQTQDVKPVLEQIQTSMDDSELLDTSVPEGKDRERFKDMFSGLNKKLFSYMDRVRHGEVKLAEAANAKLVLEKRIEQLQLEHSEQVNMLRSELDERIRQAVVAEENKAQLQQELDRYKNALANRDSSLEAQRLQQEELEQAVVREKQMTAKEARRAAEFKEALMKAHEENGRLKEECTRLKVETAKLSERVKVASLENTMHENKVAAIEKELLFSSQDVSAKLNEQRKQLEATALKKLEDMQRKHSFELGRCREMFDKKLQECLKMYVTAEDYETLKSEAQSNLKRAEQAEGLLGQRDACIQSLRNQMEQLESSHQKAMQDEKKRRERINQRVLAQTRDLEEIRTELNVYRNLVENLDVENNTFCASPMGTKRTRTSLELQSPSFEIASRILSSGSSTPNRVSQDSPQTSTEARKALLKRALTPRRRRSSGGEEKRPPIGSERDCKVM